MRADERIFIFTEAESGRLIYIKRSTDLSFYFRGPGYDVTMLRGRFGALGKFKRFTTTFDPVNGIRESSVPHVLAPLLLLRKKVETLVTLRTMMMYAMLRQQRLSSYLPLLDVNAPFELNEAARAIYHRLYEEERAGMRRKLKLTFRIIKKRIESCETLGAVDEVFQWMRGNVILGPAGAVEQEDSING